MCSQTKFMADLKNVKAKWFFINCSINRKSYAIIFFPFLVVVFFFAGYGIDVPKTHSCKLLTIPFVLIGLPFTWLLLLDVAAKWADLLNRWMHSLHSLLRRKHASHVVAPTTFIPVNGSNGANGLLKREDMPSTSVWTVETSFDQKTSQRSRSGRHKGAQWLATGLICVYPLMGSLIFGLWSQSTLPVSFAIPFISLLFISPPASSSLWWRAAFQVYLIVGWILAASCFLLWYPSWRRVCNHWANDLKMKRQPFKPNVV